MISSINVNNQAVGSSSFINQRELKQAEDLLAKNMNKDGNIDYSNKTRAEMNELGDAATLYISSLMPEEEKQSSFSMDMAITEQIYNKNAMTTDVTQTSNFKNAEANFGTEAATKGTAAASAMESAEEALAMMEAKIEEQALEAEAKAAAELKAEQAQIEAERLAGNSSTTVTQASTNAVGAQVAQAAASVDASASDVEVEASSEASAELKVEATPSAPTQESVDTYV